MIHMSSRSSQSGSIFLYILLGIALFAALGYAVSRSFVKTDTVSDDKARLLATEIINYGNQVQNAVIKLRLRGCKDNQFDFSNSIYKTNGGAGAIPGNTQSPSDDSCDIFLNSGGGITPYIVPSEAIMSVNAGPSYPMNGHANLGVYQLATIGTDAAAGTAAANDLIFYIWGVNKNVCMKINDLLGVSNPSNSPPTYTFNGGTGGDYSNGSFVATAVVVFASAPTKQTLCYEFSPGYYNLLVTMLSR